MHRPLSPIFFVGVFLLVVIAAVLMLAQVMSRQEEGPSSTPRAAIALQLALVQQGDAVGLRLTCREDLRGQVTPEAVQKAQAAYANVALDSLVGSVGEEEVEEGKPRAIPVLTPEGTVLTRLVLVGREWQSESLWFL